MAKYVKKREAEERARKADEWAAENLRVSKQRGLFAALDPCPAKDRLIKMMNERVIHLFDQCMYEQADFILEFMPEDEVTTILDEYFFGEG